jgi:beta-xylosidase
VIYSCSNPHESSWSDPVHFEYPGYDTSLFWDDDGKAYMVGSFYWRVSSVRLVDGIPYDDLLDVHRYDPKYRSLRST